MMEMKMSLKDVTSHAELCMIVFIISTCCFVRFLLLQFMTYI